MSDAACRVTKKCRVVIVERILNHYRVPFYNHLRKLLSEVDIDLQLLIGKSSKYEAKKMDEGSLDWATSIPTHYLFGNRLCWQPFGSYLKDADLVVVMHENKLLYNLCLLGSRTRPQIAFWGHGCNMQAVKSDNIRERFKRWTIKRVNWYFAYTESTAKIVRATGFPNSRITVVENAVDTTKLSAWCSEFSEGDRQLTRSRLQIESGPVGLYVGSLYREKCLDFLLEAAQQIRIRIPSFHLIIVGDGPDRAVVAKACEKNPWLHYTGPLHGKEKAEVLMISDFMLNPGVVGLGVLDSFVSGRPMFTTQRGLHSPEISYMDSGQNGLITGNAVEEYVAAVLYYIQNPEALGRLKEGAQFSALHYTIENMAARFCAGVVSCIGARRVISPMPENLRDV